MGKSIALFGTSADPPTIGHKKILEELSKIYGCTISYVSNNPKKKHIEDISIRSHLLKTLIEDLDNPKIFVDCTAIAAWINAMGPYGNNESPLVKGAVNKITFLTRLKDVLTPTWVTPKNKLLIDIFLNIFLVDSPFKFKP